MNSLLHRIKLRSDSPVFVTLFAAVAYGVFVLVRLAVHDWDASFFVTAGDAVTNPATAPPSLHIMQNAQGHDGQFYYRFALRPFTNEVTEFGTTLDLPAYRHQRILFPLVVHLLSGGSAAWVPFWMLTINYLGLCAIAWVAAKYVKTYGLHSAWALAIVCYPGFVLTLARDFTEIFAASFVLTGLWLARREKHGVAAGSLTLGVLARETTVLISFTLLLTGLARRFLRKSPSPAFVFAIPVAAGVAWQLWLRYNWGHFASADTGTMSLPFVAYVQSLMEKTAFATGQQTAAFFQMLLITAFAIAVGFAWKSSRAAVPEKLVWLLYVTLACVVSGNVWSEDWSFLRNLWELYVFGAIILMTSTSRAKLPLFACWGLLWLFELALRTDLHKVVLGLPLG